MKYILSDSVIAEPLILQWYASPWLIAPATAAFLWVKEKIPLLENYLNNLKIADAAAQWEEFKNGQFVHLSSAYQEPISILLELMLQKVAPHREFVTSYFEILEKLKTKEGQSIGDLKNFLPKNLQGYSEIDYDLLHRASISLIESLLYHSPLSLALDQQVCLYKAGSDERTPYSTTPRIRSDSKNEYWISRPFTDQFYDDLFMCRWKPANREFLRECLDIDPLLHPWNNFFQAVNVPQNTIQSQNLASCFSIQYLGHAGLLISYDKFKILIDPIIPPSFEKASPRFSWSSIDFPIDYTLITHAHPDHLHIETLLQLRNRIKNIVVPQSSSFLLDPSLKLILKHLGFQNVSMVEPLDSIELSSTFSLMAIPFQGEHAELGIKAKTGYLICADGRKTLILADGNILDAVMYEHLFQLIGEIDDLFISLECEGAPLGWIAKPFFKDIIPWKLQHQRKWVAATSDQIINLAKIFSIKNVYLYAMGYEPWLQAIMSIDHEGVILEEIEKLKAECQINSIKLTVLKQPQNID